MSNRADQKAQSEFIAGLVKDPDNPPDVQKITGRIGSASKPDCKRIYLDAAVQDYVEIEAAKVLHVASMDVPGEPGLSNIWLAADAEVHLPAPMKQTVRSYFRNADTMNSATESRGPTIMLDSAELVVPTTAKAAAAALAQLADSLRRSAAQLKVKEPGRTVRVPICIHLYCKDTGGDG